MAEVGKSDLAALDEVTSLVIYGNAASVRVDPHSGILELLLVVETSFRIWPGKGNLPAGLLSDVESL